MRIIKSGSGAALLLSMALSDAEPLRAQENDGLAAVGVSVSVLGILGTGAYDILTARSSVRRYNEQALSLAPWFDLDEQRYGLSLSLAVGGPSAPAQPGAASSLQTGLSTQNAKSPGAGTLWSLGATLVPAGIGIVTATAGGWNDNHTTLGIAIAAIGSGLLFGPSAGHWYAERNGRAWTTTGLRAGLLVLGLVALSGLEFD